MLLKMPEGYWKAFGVVFTSVLAPVGIRHLDGPGNEAPLPEPIPATTSFIPPQDLPAATTRIVARGDGPTPEAAFQSAVDAAIHQAVAAEVSAADWNQHGRAYLAILRRNGDGVLRGWRELSGASERHLIRRVFHSEVAVDVDGEALRERLHPAGHQTRP